MIDLPVLAVGIIMHLVSVLFILCSIVLILAILIQKGKGGGLSAAFGGGVAGGLMGSKTGDFLTWVTIVLVGVFLLLAILMAKFYRPGIGDYGRGGPPAGTQQPVTDQQGDSGGGAVLPGADSDEFPPVPVSPDVDSGGALTPAPEANAPPG